MPIHVGIWKLGDAKLVPVAYSKMDSEKRLETVLAEDISVVDPDLMLVGRQVATAYGKFIDLLALDSAGRVVVLELKRDRTPREVVAQLLDYGSWVRGLKEDDLTGIYAAFVEKQRANLATINSGATGAPQSMPASLDQAFRAHFATEDGLPENLNESHKLVLVASELDESSERIITYLAEEHGVAINAVFFRVFRDGANEYLTRAWLTDPQEVEATVARKREKLPWNGEYYASYGMNERRDWEEARRYGFISAGGGRWYSRTLEMLEPDGRVWVNLARGGGYAGVGIVEEASVPVDEFKVDDGSGKMVPITSLPLKAAKHIRLTSDPDKAEHFVRIRWIHAVPEAEAVREPGMFGNQNSAAKPRVRRWQATVDRLRELWRVE